MDLPEPGHLDAGVNLGRGDRGVAEHLLDDAEVGAAGQEVGGEAVPERVRADLAAGSPAARAWLLTIRQRPTRDSGRPVRETNTVVVSGRRRDQRRAVVGGRRPERLAGPRPSGTIRSLSPLPTHRADAAARGRGRPAAGRRPPRRGSRSRTGSPAPRGRAGRAASTRSAASSSRSTAAGPSTVGSRSQTVGATRSLATFSVSRPSKIRNRKNVDRLARCRPMLLGASRSRARQST